MNGKLCWTITPQDNFSIFHNMSNKEIAKHFIELVGSGQIEEGFSKHVAENFIHHNQYFKGDRESIMEAMKEDNRNNPNLSFTVHKCLQERNQVMTFSKVVKKDMEIAVVHMYLLKEDMIHEMWDIGQVIEKESPNENGVF